MSKEMIQKPLGLLKKELQDKIIDSVNNSELPLYMSEYIIDGILNTIRKTIMQQESSEIAEYEKKLAKFNKEE